MDNFNDDEFQPERNDRDHQPDDPTRQQRLQRDMPSPQLPYREWHRQFQNFLDTFTPLTPPHPNLELAGYETDEEDEDREAHRTLRDQAREFYNRLDQQSFIPAMYQAHFHLPRPLKHLTRFFFLLVFLSILFYFLILFFPLFPIIINIISIIAQGLLEILRLFPFLISQLKYIKPLLVFSAIDTPTYLFKQSNQLRLFLFQVLPSTKLDAPRTFLLNACLWMIFLIEFNHLLHHIANRFRFASHRKAVVGFVIPYLIILFFAYDLILRHPESASAIASIWALIFTLTEFLTYLERLQDPVINSLHLMSFLINSITAVYFLILFNNNT